MPSYFVEVNDGRAEQLDAVETDAPGPEALRDDVMRMLAETARCGVACGSGEQLLVAAIRDDADQRIYRVMLALTCSRLGCA